MSGLIYKNYYVIRKQGTYILRVVLIIILLTELMLLSVRFGNLKALYLGKSAREDIIPISYVIVTCLFLCTFCYYEITASDEKAKWKMMMYSMPLDSGDIVLSGYISFYSIVIAMFFAGVISEAIFILTLGIEFKTEYFYVIFCIFITYWIIQCLIMPFSFINHNAVFIVLGVSAFLLMAGGFILMIFSKESGIDVFKYVKLIYKWLCRLSIIVIPIVTFVSVNVAKRFENRRRYLC